MFLRLTGEADGTDVINPCLEVGLLGLSGVAIRPRHHDLGGARKGQQRFAAPNADRLKISYLLRIQECVRCFAHVPKAFRERLHR